MCCTAKLHPQPQLAFFPKELGAFSQGGLRTLWSQELTYSWLMGARGDHRCNWLWLAAGEMACLRGRGTFIAVFWSQAAGITLGLPRAAGRPGAQHIGGPHPHPNTPFQYSNGTGLAGN